MKMFILFISFSFFAIFQVSAQKKIGSLKGILIDSISKEPLKLATITVFVAADTTLISYKLSDMKGEFNISNLPLGVNLRVLITMSGYKVVRQEFNLTDNISDLSLDQIHLSKDTISLDEVIVFAERPPVLFRKDTIEFNVASFKYLPTALVEDLLKKLPGVEVSRDGNIRVNGQMVNRILVDGKEFFGGDIRIATRNLPANIIDKIQVFDDDEQKLRNPGLNTEDLGKIVNLKLKKYIKRGWFGKGYVGGGTRDRFENGAMLNSFRDTLQISLLYYANNINKSAFTSSDILSVGGFARSYFHDLNTDSKGNVQNIDGLSFGGNNQGIESTLGTGININNQISKKSSINFQYFFGQKKLNLQNVSNTTQFINDTSIFSNIKVNSNNKDFSHQFGGSYRKKINPTSNFNFRPILIISKGSQETINNTFSNTNYLPFLNSVATNGNIKGTGLDYSQEIAYQNNKLSKKATLSLINNSRFYSNKSNLFNTSNNIFYSDTGAIAYNIDQLRKTLIKGFGTITNINYSLRLSAQLSLRISTTLDYSKGKQDIITYEKSTLTGQYDSLNSLLSDSLTLTRFKADANAFFEKTLSKKASLSLGINFQSINLNSALNSGEIIKRYNYIFPYFRLRINKFTLSYTPRVNEPSINDLQPLLDNTNTLFEKVGNINLKPTISHKFYFGKVLYNPVNKFLYSFYIEPYLIVNDLSYNKTVNEKGIQVITPENINGNKGITAFLLLSKGYKFKKNNQFNLQITTRGQYRKKAIIINNISYGYNTLSFLPSLKYFLSLNDILEINQQFSYTWNKSYFNSNIIKPINFNSYNIESDFSLRKPKNFVWETNVNYQAFPKALLGSTKQNFLVNLSLSYSFLKEKQATFRAKVFDLLKNNTGLSQITEQNFIQVTEVNMLKRFFLLSFTYNFRYFGPKKQNIGALFGLF